MHTNRRIFNMGNNNSVTVSKNGNSNPQPLANLLGSSTDTWVAKDNSTGRTASGSTADKAVGNLKK